MVRRFICVAFVVAACGGEQGPQGPAGAQGPPGSIDRRDVYCRTGGEATGPGANRLESSVACDTVDDLPIDGSCNAGLGLPAGYYLAEDQPVQWGRPAGAPATPARWSCAWYHDTSGSPGVTTIPGARAQICCQAVGHAPALRADVGETED